jgi:hypothetical protein
MLSEPCPAPSLQRELKHQSANPWRKETEKSELRLDTPWMVLGGSSHLVSGLVHPSYKWINPTYPIYNWGYNPLTLRG